MYIRNRNCVQPMRRSNMHLKGSLFFFLGRGGIRGGWDLEFLGFFYYSQCIPIMFAMNSQHVSPSSQDVLNCT
jgi:hypothetical protein